MTKINTQPLLPRSQTRMWLTREAGQQMRLDTPQGIQIMFSKGIPVAVRVAGVVYFSCQPGPEQRAVNAWRPEDPHIRAEADQFDFLVGQALTSAGLPLTRKES